MILFDIMFIGLLLVVLGLVVALCFQQALFLRSIEKLEQKLLARDLTEYVDHQIAQEKEDKPFFSFNRAGEELEEQEEDVYMDIDQMPSDEAHEAIMNHINGK